MNSEVIPSWLLIVLGMGGCGVYLRLVAARAARPRAVEGTGTVLCVLCLVLLVAGLGRSADEWPHSPPGGSLSSFFFWIMAGGTVLSAGAAVTSRTTATSAVWFGLMLLATSGLLLLLGAAAVGLFLLLIAIGGLAVGGWSLAWSLPWGGGERRGKVWRAEYGVRNSDDSFRSPDSAGSTPHEPLLACIAGVLISAALIGAVRHDLAAREAGGERRAESQRSGARGQGSEISGQGSEVRDQRSVVLTLNSQLSTLTPVPLGTPHFAPRSSPFLGASLIIGAILFAVGAVGLLARSSPGAMLIAAGVMSQGVILTLVAFGASQTDSVGQRFAGWALALTALQASVCLWLAMVGRRLKVEG